MSQFLQKSLTPARQNTIDEELAKMVARDFQPFSIVDDKGFRRFTHALNPMYAIPSRKSLSQKIIPGLYNRERASLQETVKKQLTAGHPEPPHPTCQLHATLLKITKWCPVFWIVLSSVTDTLLRT